MSFTRTKPPHEANRVDNTAANLPADQAAVVPKPVQSTKERRTPGAGGEQAAEQDNGIDAEPAFMRPIGVGVKTEPQGKLVLGKGGAEAVADCHQAAQKH